MKDAVRITVRGQNLIPEDGPGCGRPGEIEFSFSRDWDRFLKFAQFTQHGRTFNTMLAENRCRLPPEIREGPYYLNVTGITPDSRDRATSCYILLRAPGTGPMGGGPPPFPDDPPPRDLYAELQRQMEEAIRQAASLTLDTTLTEEGKAAESRATGEAISQAREAALQAVSGETGHLAEEIAQVRADLDEALERLNGAEASTDEISALREKAEALAKAVEEMEAALADLAALEGRMKKAEENGSASRERLETLEAESGKQRGQLAALEGAGERTAGAVSDLLSRVSAQERRMDQAEAADGRTGARLEALEKSSGETAGALTLLEGKVPGLAAEVEDLSTRCDRRLDALEAAEGDDDRSLRLLEGKAETLLRAQDTLAGDIRNASEKTAALSDTVQALSRTSEETRAEQNRLRENQRRGGELLHRLEGRGEENARRLGDMEKRMTAAEGTAGEHTAAIDVLNKTVLAHTVTLEALKDRRPDCGHPHPGGGDPEAVRRALRRADDAMEIATRAARDLDTLTRRVTTNESDQTRLQTRLEQEIRGAVMIQQGMQHAGRILGISEDGRVEPVDRRLAGQVQADLAQTDRAQADYVKSKPFDIYDGYMAVSGLVLLSQDRTPYLLRVNDRGDLAVSEFTI